MRVEPVTQEYFNEVLGAMSEGQRTSQALVWQAIETNLERELTIAEKLMFIDLTITITIALKTAPQLVSFLQMLAQACIRAIAYPTIPSVKSESIPDSLPLF